MAQIPQACLKRLKPLIDPAKATSHNPILRAHLKRKHPRFATATATSPSNTHSTHYVSRRATFNALNFQALRSLAKHLFHHSSDLARSLLANAPAAASRSSRHLPSNLAGRVFATSARPTFHPSSANLRGFRGGFRGIGSAPMGPAGRQGFTSVTQVGLGSARAYSSAARPLFENLANAPVVLRALANSLEDKVEHLKSARPPPASHLKAVNGSSSSKQSTILFQAPTFASYFPEVEPTEAELYSLYFSASPAHTLATPSPASADTTTTLLIPFSIPTPVPTSRVSLSALASSHRAAYDNHARKVDALIDALTQRGAFLDDLVWLETVREGEQGDVLGLRIVFECRNEQEVRQILDESRGCTRGEGDWFFLQSSTHSQPTSVEDITRSAFVFPTLSFSSSSTFNPSFPPSPEHHRHLDTLPIATELADDLFAPSGFSTPASASLSPYASTVSIASLSSSSIAASSCSSSAGSDSDFGGNESVFLGFSSSFLSDRESIVSVAM